jgi:hypothetical protein
LVAVGLVQVEPNAGLIVVILPHQGAGVDRGTGVTNGIQCGYILPHRIDCLRRQLTIWERRTTRGIVDQRGAQAREVAIMLRRGGHRSSLGNSLPVAKALVVAKEKQFVCAHRAASR